MLTRCVVNKLFIALYGQGIDPKFQIDWIFDEVANAD